MNRDNPFSLMQDPPPEAVKMAKKLKGIVGKHYSILESSFDERGFYYTVILDRKTHPDNFEALRLSLKKLNMFPRVVNKEGEWIIAIFRYPERKRYSVRVNLLLLILTFFTTFWAGAILWEGYSNGVGEVFGVGGIFGVLKSPTAFLYGGLSFGLPLIAILGTHEFGHYFLSKKHNVDASLPFFIPIPPFIAPFGTFGALISMRENIPNRRALVEIGAAGPISGFVVALPIIYIGLKLSTKTLSPEDLAGPSYGINLPLIFYFFTKIAPLGRNVALHPTAIAGWIGVFVTALNLLPMGQLDGGHIVRGIFGEHAKHISLAFIFFLILLSFATGFYTYLFFVFLVFLFGIVHPPPLDDISPLHGKQRMVALTALLLFLLSFHPVPIYMKVFQTPEYSFQVESPYNVTYLLPGEAKEASFSLLNDGSETLHVEIGVWGALYSTGGLNWTPGEHLKIPGINLSLQDIPKRLSLKKGEKKIFTFTAEAAPGNITERAVVLEFNFTSPESNRSLKERFWILLTPLRVEPVIKEYVVFPGNGIRHNISVKNLLRTDIPVIMKVSGNPEELELPENATSLILAGGEEKNVTTTIFTSSKWEGEEITVEISMWGSEGDLLGLSYAVLKSG